MFFLFPIDHFVFIQLELNQKNSKKYIFYPYFSRLIASRFITSIQIQEHNEASEEQGK